MSQLLGLGLSQGFLGSGIGGSSPPPYTTGAVGFDGATVMTLSSLVSPADNSLLTFSYWLEISHAACAAIAEMIPWTGDVSLFTLGAEMAGGVGIPDFLPPYTARDYTGDLTGDNSWTFDAAPTPDSIWVNILIAYNTASGVTQRFLNDVDTSAGSLTGAFPFIMNMTGRPFVIGGDDDPSPDDGFSFLGNQADWWLASDVFLDLSVVANRRKFISSDGRPVSLGVDGSAPTGSPPTFFLRRAPGADPTTFANDLSGNGNDFTITGTLTNAPSSPTD